jgi:hypothetical protein
MDDNGIDRKATGEGDGDELRQRSMTFNEGMSERRG